MIVRLDGKVVKWFTVADTIDESDSQTPYLPEIDTEALNETD